MLRTLLSLRVHLLVLVLGAMLPGAILTAVLISRIVADARTVVERQMLDAARLDAAALDREFESQVRTLQALAVSPTLDREDLRDFYDEARRVHLVEQAWHAVLLLDLAGRHLVSTRAAWGEPLMTVHERTSFDQVLATHAPTIGAVASPPGDDTVSSFAVRVPVLRDGELRYVLTALVLVGALDRLVTSPSTSVEAWTRTIIDPHGVVAARTRDTARFVGRALPPGVRERLVRHEDEVFRETALDGTEVYATSSRGRYGWRSSVLVARSVIDAPIRTSNLALLAGVVTLMVCGLLAVFVMSKRLSRDLHGVASAAESLAHGRLEPPPRPVHLAETRRLLDALDQAASLLDHRQHERDDEVQRARAARLEAERANRTKDHFLAVLGHELRNPLAPALTALELMRIRDPGALERERHVLERQIGHMVRLVEDLLDIARLARGQITLRPSRFELREAVDRAIVMASPMIDRRQHPLAVDVPAFGLALDADRDRLVQILTNLLANAAKYTPAGSPIRVHARADSGMAVIACEDEGPGVPSDQQRALFDPFEQGPRSIDRREGGLGLGLALARRLAELHGGSIEYEDRVPGPGSRFVVRLPLATGPAPAGPAGPPVAASAARAVSRRILVVDDNADALETVEEALTMAGHVVEVAADGAAALALARDHRLDAAILDIGLPGMNGYDLAQRLREVCPDILLIALTGYGQPSDATAARDAGFDAHFAKPLPMSVLLDEIERLSTARA